VFSPADRVIHLTETCDLVAPETSDQPGPERRFALLVFFATETRVWLLEEGTTVVVGREAPCEIVVRDSSVSRQHARFTMRSGEIWVEDLDSRNGTLRSGRRIQRERLEPGDEVTVGTARLLLVGTRSRRVEEHESAIETGSVDHVVHNVQMKKLYEDVARVSRTNVPVLILGESGSGKEHVAAAVHTCGARKDGPFVIVNCAAIPPSLLEATLFGHERGAFTGAVGKAVGMFERANGGTLFLDEIGELTASAQAALLRAVESQRISRVGSSTEVPVDARLVAATHCDLEAMVEDGTFRQDLYFRLNGIKLLVPPLRERTDELDLLVRRFVERARQEWDIRTSGVAADAMDALRAYAWPGNVRQLRHAIERAALLSTSDVIKLQDLPDYVFARAERKEAPQFVTGLSDLALRDQLVKFERALIEEALQRTGGNRRAASRLLRIPVRTLFRKLRTTSEPNDGEAST
jgi:DNA-binding NtrC family response regulator